MPDPTHEERMASFRHARTEKDDACCRHCGELLYRENEQGLCEGRAPEIAAYCNDLAAQLEAEREKVRHWEYHPVENVNRGLRSANARQTARVQEAESKLQTAEREVELLRWRVAELEAR